MCEGFIPLVVVRWKRSLRRLLKLEVFVWSSDFDGLNAKWRTPVANTSPCKHLRH
jgi:hypothetical protein